MPSRLSRRARAALDRTKASRALLDERSAGADLSDLEAYPVVIYPRGKPKPPGIKRIGIARYREDDDDGIVEAPERPPIAPPVPYDPAQLRDTNRRARAAEVRPRAPYKCSECHQVGHTRKNCPKFALEPIAAPVIVTPTIAPVPELAQRRPRRCHGCDETGHDLRNCPMRARELEPQKRAS